MIVKFVMQASGAQVLEWRHLKNALMEHIAALLVQDIVFCVQKVIGEVFWVLAHFGHISTESIYPFMILFINIIGGCLTDRLQRSPGNQTKPSIRVVWCTHTYWVAATEPGHRYNCD